VAGTRIALEEDEMSELPALSLVAMPGRRARTIEIAREAERRGFPGIYCPSLAGDQLSFCVSMAQATSTVWLGTSIQPIYFRKAWDLAQTGGFLNEISGGRFRLGIGVSHGPTHERLGLATGKPLSDMRSYVAELRQASGQPGGLPPIVLATLRNRMLDLAVEIGDGAVWANAARSHMAEQLARIPADRQTAGFFIGNMIPTVIDDDREAAAAVNRKTLTGYVRLPNYRRYWVDAGYGEEMGAIEKALAEDRADEVPSLMSDRWLSDVTLYGSVAQVRDGVEAWQDAGVTTPILVPSSTSGGQMKAIEELFAAFA
jgi:alkanesulfonate monooxygenase SsuD/methylene tetrahydromethanopterin reductase-like flavin-dependent oxidoreductase (luciferase family)